MPDTLPERLVRATRPDATGNQVIYPDGTLTKTVSGLELRQAALGPLDGFSPATPILVYFPQEVDPSGLTRPIRLLRRSPRRTPLPWSI